MIAQVQQIQIQEKQEIQQIFEQAMQNVKVVNITVQRDRVRID